MRVRQITVECATHARWGMASGAHRRPAATKGGLLAVRGAPPGAHVHGSLATCPVRAAACAGWRLPASKWPSLQPVHAMCGSPPMVRINPVVLNACQPARRYAFAIVHPGQEPALRALTLLHLLLLLQLELDLALLV